MSSSNTNNSSAHTSSDLVSIIIPCYNCAKYIRSTIDDIFSQSYTNIECIVVDDGSSDESLAICEEIAKKDKRVRIFPKTHAGVAAARNYGIRQAKGKWIQQIDADDKLHPDKISLHMQQLASLEQSRNIIFYTDWDIIWEDKNLEYSKGDTIIVGNKSKSELLKQLVMWNFLPNSPLSNNTIFCKRTVFDIKMYDESLGAFEDFDLFTSLLLADIDFVYTPIVGMSYLQHTTNMTSNKSKMISNYIRYLEILNEKDPSLLKHCISIGNLLCETLINREKERYYKILELIDTTDVSVRLCNTLNSRNITLLKTIFLIRSILPVLTLIKLYKEILRLPKRVRWHMKNRLGF